MRDILSSLSKLFDGVDVNGTTAEAIVFAAWKNIVGEGLGQHIAPVRLIKRRLIVAVANETWRKQVIDLSEQMVFKLNAAVGSSLVSYVDFRVDAKTVRAHQLKLQSDQTVDAEWAVLAEQELTPQIQQAAENISDEALRTVFLSAAGSSLARKRKSSGSRL